MRITDHEARTIKEAIAHACPTQSLYLFGSRADDVKKGGDIDLFLEPRVHLSLYQQLVLQNRLITLCDARVDLVVKNPDAAEQPFYHIARQGIRLM